MASARGAVVPLAWRRRAASPAAAGRAVRHLGIDGPLRPHAALLPARDHQRPRSRAYAALRHAAHQHHAASAAARRRRGAGARERRGVGLGGRHAHRRVSGGIQPALVAAAARAGCGGAAHQRRARQRRGPRPVCGNGAPRQVVPAPHLAQSAAALRSSSRRGRQASARCCPTSTISCRCTIWRA